jgi:hypothetical protein
MNAQKFWEHVDKTIPTACWIWKGGYSGSGYGSLALDGRNGLRAHRVAWELTNGDIPTGLCVLHRCDNKKCVNPAHLFLGTFDDNNKDRAAKGRSGATGCHFEAHPMAKLNWIMVKQIRELRELGFTMASLAQNYGVTPSTIYYIVHNKIWKEDISQF